MAGRSEKWLTDEEVEREIERLRGSEAVKLAQKKKRLDSKRRLYMYQLRQMERQGLALMDAYQVHQFVEKFLRLILRQKLGCLNRVRQQFDFVKFKSRIEQFITLAFFGMVNFETIHLQVFNVRIQRLAVKL